MLAPEPGWVLKEAGWGFDDQRHVARAFQVEGREGRAAAEAERKGETREPFWEGNGT